MSQVVIENPVINSPFEEPARHFSFDEQGITNTIVPERRISQYFIPIAKPRKTANDRQQTFDEWTEDRIEENKTVNAIRQLIQLWREGRYTDDVTRTTARLLEYWQRNDRTRRLFFCQIEALETLIYITEVAKRYGHTWIENDLRRFNENANPGLLRIAAKMATGSGKTVVIAMLIVWHVLNKLANPRDARFTDSFLIVTPGITIRDRLRVLLPSDPTNYYRALALVPPDLMDQIAHAKIVITNFHAFRRREKI
jgi:type III restriction enzyme